METETIQHCRIELLRPLRVVRADRTITHFPRQKTAHLLAYLALRPQRPHFRERLVDLLWPDLDLPAGRDSLSTTLTALRPVLEPPGTPRGAVLVATRQHIGLNPEAVWIDAAEFERRIAQAKKIPEPGVRAQAWAKTAALYQGEPLAGMYSEWALQAAERLRCLFVEILQFWSESLEENGDLAGAREIARRWVTAEPHAEEAHLYLIGLHARAGHHAEATAAARRMEQLWQEEFQSPLPPAILAKIAALLPS